jgi:hypothetical protein
MRATLFAVLMSAGIGLVAVSSAVAAPANGAVIGAVIGDAAAIFQPTPVARCQGPRYYQCRHYTYSSVRRCGYWRNNFNCY